MITVNFHPQGDNNKGCTCYLELNITHIREKDQVIEEEHMVEQEMEGEHGEKWIHSTYTIRKRRVFNQFGGYTVAAYSLPNHMRTEYGANHNRIVIARCSPKDNYDRHKGIMVCLEKIVEKLWPEGGFTLVPQFTDNGGLISSEKVININLV